MPHRQWHWKNTKHSKIKRTRLRATSDKGAIVKQIDDLLLIQLKKERGDICEIHNRKCANIGKMHILPKGKYPRIRFNTFNLILAGWFCSHFWTHHDSEDPRAIYTKQRITELRGPDYKDRLLFANKIAPKLTMTYLQGYLYALTKY